MAPSRMLVGLLRLSCLSAGECFAAETGETGSVETTGTLFAPPARLSPPFPARLRPPPPMHASPCPRRRRGQGEKLTFECREFVQKAHVRVPRVRPGRARPRSGWPQAHQRVFQAVPERQRRVGAVRGRRGGGGRRPAPAAAAVAAASAAVAAASAAASARALSGSCDIS
jgi:hypothetical protein